jgi:hypothetical protein
VAATRRKVSSGMHCSDIARSGGRPRRFRPIRIRAASPRWVVGKAPASVFQRRVEERVNVALRAVGVINEPVGDRSHLTQQALSRRRGWRGSARGQRRRGDRCSSAHRRRRKPSDAATAHAQPTGGAVAAFSGCCDTRPHRKGAPEAPRLRDLRQPRRGGALQASV